MYQKVFLNSSASVSYNIFIDVAPGVNTSIVVNGMKYIRQHNIEVNLRNNLDQECLLPTWVSSSECTCDLEDIALKANNTVHVFIGGQRSNNVSFLLNGI